MKWKSMDWSGNCMYKWYERAPPHTNTHSSTVYTNKRKKISWKWLCHSLERTSVECIVLHKRKICIVFWVDSGNYLWLSCALCVHFYEIQNERTSEWAYDSVTISGAIFAIRLIFYPISLNLCLVSLLSFWVIVPCARLLDLYLEMCSVNRAILMLIPFAVEYFRWLN